MNRIHYLSKFIFSSLLALTGTPLLGAVSDTHPQLIPMPQSIVPHAGNYILPKEVAISFQGPDSIRQQISRYLQSSRFQLMGKKRWRKAPIQITLDTSLAKTPTSEAYQLEIQPKGIHLKAGHPAGIFYGLQTLSQLAESGRDTLKAMTIEDAPRFAYRGMMLDVSRHFFDKEFVCKQIDMLSRFKINRLHLHLTDAAGWRLEIKSYPELTRLAAWRPEARWKDWWKGKRSYVTEGTPGAYGGYYTQDDIREILAYAADRQVTIIPEIEMPSHSEEVFAAYPELCCSGEAGSSSDFCVGKEQTFTFLEEVLTEVMQLFPSEYIHIGGDEAPKTAWRTCPLCQKRMKEEGLKDVDELQSYLIRRIERFLNSHGRKLLGWDEILDGGLAPRATVMSWRGTEGGLAAVKSGHHAIMTPGQFCYLDSYQDAPHTQPEAIGGYLPLEKIYTYNPVPEELTAEEAALIYGVQANLWTEYVPNEQHAEYMMYPRMLALAEIGWTQLENKSWPRFHKAALKAVARMQEQGYHPFDLSKETGNRIEARDTLKHLAYGKKVTYKAPYWRTYAAGGEKALTDGLRGGWNYNDGRWQGFVSQKRLDVVIDLEQSTSIRQISADFMQICGPEVFLPEQVIISISEDGETFRTLAEHRHEVVRDDAVTFKNYGWQGETHGRYVRFQALAGEKFGGVVFTDEIVIR